MSATTTATLARALVAGTLTDPHSLLGVHDDGMGATAMLRAWWPGAVAAHVDGVGPLRRIDPAGLFEAPLSSPLSAGYGVRYEFADGSIHVALDPWPFWPTLGDIDLHLIGEGRHERLWDVLGAHARVHEGLEGTAFAVWAPSARSVRVVGDWNGWDGRVHPMRSLGASGVWEMFLPGVEPGAHYKFEMLGADGSLRLKADPLATAAQHPPANASVVFRSAHRWGDDVWLADRASHTPVDEHLSIYEVHLGSWRRHPDGSYLSYDELGEQLADHVSDLGFTHVELLPPSEHPYDPSWGYQVSSYYAPTARFGDPDGFRRFVDRLHRNGIGVLVDWVPAHFPRDDWALARFDGSALYEHADPRLGEHPDWGTLVFNFGRHEVRNFLGANARYWLSELHVDGLRVDAVASMLYLDYSRGIGEWVPNVHGGRENLEAISFLREVNVLCHRDVPGILTIAEESTSFDGVSRPVHHGGLGFSHKWNMGWMHDTLDYFSHDPVHRPHHHHELTFGLLYAWSENFVLPLSHDEVVHGKRSLLSKMPGDDWQRHANLRSLYAWMWAHPGKQLVFMGAELAQAREWNHDHELDWWHLDDAGHRGVHDLLRELNHVQAGQPALWSQDTSPEGFGWISADDRDHSIYAFLRWGRHGEVVACVANLTPVPRHGYRLGLPRAGRWVDLVNTDDHRWGGSGLGHPVADTDGIPWQGQPDSAVLTLPPLSVRWLSPAGDHRGG